MDLDADLRKLATAGNFAALTTLGPDGAPSTHVMWVDADDEHLLINTEVHRQKYKNVTRDPRVAVTVIDSASPYRFIEARGRVVGTITGQPARDHVEALSRRYTGEGYTAPVQSERVILQIEPQNRHGSRSAKSRRRPGSGRRAPSAATSPSTQKNPVVSTRPKRWPRPGDDEQHRREGRQPCRPKRRARRTPFRQNNHFVPPHLSSTAGWSHRLSAKRGQSRLRRPAGGSP